LTTNSRRLTPSGAICWWCFLMMGFTVASH
jgi:hypothetical protein